MVSLTITTRGGEHLGMTAFGDPSADRLVLLCHPTPGAALDPEPVVTDRWGVQVVTVDRPGYGVSETVPEDRDWTIIDHARDLAEWVRAMERTADRISNARLDRYGVVGWGTGALLAAAVAAVDEKVDRLALVDPPAPARARRLAEAAVGAPGRVALGIDDSTADLERHLGLGGRVDRMLEEAAMQGDVGVQHDARLFGDDAWLDQLHGLRAATRIWAGSETPWIEEQDARFWVDRIPGAEAVRVRDSGPLTIASAWSRILEHVAPNHGSVAEQLRDSGTVRLADVDPVDPERG